MVDALLLLSYPLHPPRKPEQLRTAHFGQLRTPALFVHGSRDPFGTVEEMTAAIALIPARTELMVVERAPHGLSLKAVLEIVSRLMRFLPLIDAESRG